MINLLVKRLLGKEIVFYAKHRQTHPLVNNTFNRRTYLFIESTTIWKYIPFKNEDKRKHKIMYFILQCLRPKYIVSINWISRSENLFKVWTASNPGSKFIVVQHGAYVGGVVNNKPHKYTNCDIFLTWGPYFVKQFKKNNSHKKVEILNFGNPVYNQFDRSILEYRKEKTNKILLLPTALNNKDIQPFYNLIKRLLALNFKVVVKAHNRQGREKNIDGSLKYPVIVGVEMIEGDLSKILQMNDYDFIISDHSTSLLDAIFFKNKVIYFDPNNSSKGYTTNYSIYLKNLYLENLLEINGNSLYHWINLEKQEELFENMITIGNNKLVI